MAANDETRERALARFRTIETQTRYDLQNYIPFCTPEYVAPEHLGVICNLYDRIERGEQVFACVGAPPRHAKSEIIFHGSARRLRWSPRKRIAYVTYSQEIANDQSRIAQRRAAAAGVQFQSTTRGVDLLDPSASVRLWQTAIGGGFLAAGRQGGIVSKGFDLFHFDDPFKNRKEAESVNVRDEVWEGFKGDALTRLEPGASVIVSHQRWNDDDLIARIKKMHRNNPENTRPWEFYDIPAINDAGQPLWPQRYNLRELALIRAEVGEYNWWSQYMQRPRRKGGRVLPEPARYSPPAMLVNRRVVIAADTAGTKGTSSDHTAIVIAAFYTAEYTDPEGVKMQMPFADVLRVYRFQAEIPDVVRVLKVLADDWPGVPMVVETQGGDGRSVAQTLLDIDSRLPIHPSPRHVDKFTAAQPLAAAFGQGRWRVPLAHDPKYDSLELQKLLRKLEAWDEGKWIAPYLSECESFNGITDAEDDQVDGSAHCWDHGSMIAGTFAGEARTRGARKAANSGGF